MKLFGSFVLAVTAPCVVSGGVVRGVLKDIEPSNEIRELKKNNMGGGGGGGNMGGGGGDGNQSGNGGGGGEGVADGCPNFMKGWPSGVKNCQAEGNAGCAAPCGGSTSGTCCCVASNGYNFCGNPTSEDCNFSTRCVNDDHTTPVASSTNTKETIKIYENKNGVEIIETGNVKVSVAQDGTETIQIAPHNNVRSEAVHHGVASTHKKVQNVEVASNPQKASDCPGPNDLYVKLRIQVDHEFDEHGKYTLDDDDDDDDDSGKYWDESSFSTGDLVADYACLPRNECYAFEITGKGKAFDPDDNGYAKLWVDNGDGTLRRLICLNAENNPEAEDDDDSGDPQCPDGEFETARTWFGCDCKEYGGYSGGCPETGSDDDDDSDNGMDFVSPNSCQEDVLCDVGDGGNPSTAFPLGRCQGDCDKNEDCQGSMICFERDDYDQVPGCSGEGSKDTDYCIEAVETSTHHHHHTGN